MQSPVSVSFCLYCPFNNCSSDRNVHPLPANMNSSSQDSPCHLKIGWQPFGWQRGRGSSNPNGLLVLHSEKWTLFVQGQTAELLWASSIHIQLIWSRPQKKNRRAPKTLETGQRGFCKPQSPRSSSVQFGVGQMMKWEFNGSERTRTLCEKCEMVPTSVKNGFKSCEESKTKE